MNKILLTHDKSRALNPSTPTISFSGIHIIWFIYYQELALFIPYITKFRLYMCD